ncbi:MAG: PEP-CTERM sorting domain-containing protein [Kiritimatiellae bacterium]|nr:PEP-CTERM sorting domain-containing protein [Kiritimatiellia bacterium]
MKKSLLVVALLGAMVASAEDSYLYWMVGTDAPSNYTTAKVKDEQSGNYLTIYDDWLDESLGQSVTKAQVEEARGNDEAFYASLANVPNRESSHWIIELYEGERLIDQSTPQAYSSAYINNGMGGTSGTTAPMTGGSFATPEPNSALLMLVGCAMLGLRRRKQKKA